MTPIFFLTMLSKVLGKKYTLKTCNDPLEGLVEMVKNKPDLILLDFAMPRINGLQILEGMQKKDLNIPTIVLTGKNNWSDEQKAIKLGAVLVMYKPIKRSDLIEKIELYIN